MVNLKSPEAILVSKGCRQRLSPKVVAKGNEPVNKD